MFCGRRCSYPPLRTRTYTDDQLLRHPQLLELAFTSHPFLALIVCRTTFSGDADEKANDKLLYDAVLIAGLGVKQHLSQNSWGSQMKPHGLPDLDDLVRRTISTLYGIKLGSLNAAYLHKYAQCMTIIAWHELAHGLIR